MELRSSRPRLSWVALGGVFGTVVLGGVGGWNPWHLTYLDLSFTAPFLGVACLVGLGVLWHLHARGRALRVVGFLALVGCLLAGAGTMALIAELDDGGLRLDVANGRGDVEGELTSDYNNVWEVWLRADRGLVSRQHMVAEIGYGDSAPPSVDARFVGADELVITTRLAGSGDGNPGPRVEVYRLRFDRGDLGVEEETCRPAHRSPAEPPGCLS